MVRHGEDCTGDNCDLFDDGYCRIVWRRAVDHLWPERFLRRFCKAADPHVIENLVCITSSLHAKKTAVEYLIFRADMVGYRRELNRLGFPPDKLDKAMKAILDSAKGE